MRALIVAVVLLGIVGSQAAPGLHAASHASKHNKDQIHPHPQHQGLDWFRRRLNRKHGAQHMADLAAMQQHLEANPKIRADTVAMIDAIVLPANHPVTTRRHPKLQHAASSSSMTCPRCEAAVQTLVSIVENPALLNMTAGMIDADVCAKLTKAEDQALCRAAVSLFEVLGPKIVKGLSFLGWNDLPFNICALLFKVCTQGCCATPTVPEQIHLSFGSQGKDAPIWTSMGVTWVTLDRVAAPVVSFAVAGSPASPVSVAAQSVRTYTAAGWIGTVYYALMTGLAPNTTYQYTVGDTATGTFSAPTTFTTLPTNIGTTERPLRFLNVADMGYGNNSDATVARMTARVNNGEVDMMVHNGDISYADGYMMHWDVFSNKVQPIASRIPYMTNPGNHELLFNFTAYRTRYADSMPQPSDALPGAMYYALHVGPVTILMMDSESVIDTADITEANVAWAARQLSALNRQKSPWLLSFHHRPLYCSNSSPMDCNDFAFLLRMQIEKLYLDNKVDFVGAGHVHYYLRTYPIANGQAVDGSSDNTSYTNPTAPVYVVNGAAGNREGNPTPEADGVLYAAGTGAIGYAIFEAAAVVDNAAGTQHTLKQTFYRSADDAEMDTFTIIKDL